MGRKAGKFGSGAVKWATAAVADRGVREGSAYACTCVHSCVGARARIGVPIDICACVLIGDGPLGLVEGSGILGSGLGGLGAEGKREGQGGEKSDNADKYVVDLRPASGFDRSSIISTRRAGRNRRTVRRRHPKETLIGRVGSISYIYPTH